MKITMNMMTQTMIKTMTWSRRVIIFGDLDVLGVATCPGEGAQSTECGEGEAVAASIVALSIVQNMLWEWELLSQW